ncbi:MAG: hypothetical protein WC709_00910 [Thermoleophilia bacterium]
MRARRCDGYALLAALVITALAALLAATCVAAVSARHSVVASDDGQLRARATLRHALDEACTRLRWQPSVSAGRLPDPGASGAPDSWAAAWEPAQPQPGDRWPGVDLALSAASGTARARLGALVELRPEPFAQGVTVEADADVRAALTVGGGGLYCGGSVRGREWVRFLLPAGASGAPEPAADAVHGEVWPLAAVHALGSIWAAGAEIHDPSGVPAYPADTDTHTTRDGVLSLVAGPDPTFITALRERAVDPGEALSDGVLDLSRLPERPPGSPSAAADQAGFVVLVAPSGGRELLVVGVRPPVACPLVVVLVGDAVVGRAGTETALTGLLLCTGMLEVAGPLRVEGHLHARRLLVSESTSVATSADWRLRPLAGVSRPVAVTLDGP